MDDIDRRLLSIAQLEFPVTSEPFAALGGQLGIDAAEVLERVQALKSSGTIRYIGPLFDAAALGYQTTLVAMRIDDEQVEEASRLLAAHQGISHAYLREHRLNLWFTLAAPLRESREMEIQRLATALSAGAVFDLPALRAFKLRAYFDATGSRMPAPDSGAPSRDVIMEGAPGLLPVDGVVINAVQQDLPLVPRPFDSMADAVNMSTEAFVACCQVMLRRGVMRRYGATLRHAALGIQANALVCWSAPAGKAEEVGLRLSLLDEVSHCYLRRSYPLWPYNLYAMVHGETREYLQSLIADVSGQLGLDDYLMLFTSRELKKTRVKYSV